MLTAPSMTRANCNELIRIDTELEYQRATPHRARGLTWWRWVDYLLERRLEHTPPLGRRNTPPAPMLAASPIPSDTPRL